MNISSKLRERAEELHEKYQFKYIGSFGHDIMKRPIAIVAADHKDTLFVSDYDGNKIHKFNVQGKYLGPLSVEVKNPVGLFKDAENNLWICDFGNSRLLAVDSTDSVVDEIRLGEVLGDKFDSIHPVFGCLKGDRFYLLLVNVSYQQRRLVSFNRYNLHDSLDVLPTDVFDVLNVFEFLDNQLYVCDHAQCDLFVYNTGQRFFKRIGYQGIPYPFRRFVRSSDALFLSASKHILKVSLNGERFITANLSKILNMGQATPLGLAVLKQKDSRVLFVTDATLTCIHKFAV